MITLSLSWLREHVELPADLSAAELDAALVRVGLEVESLRDLATSVTGPLVVGRVLEIEQLPKLKKPIRYCQVEVGEEQPRGIICGAPNFAVGDLVVVALPGAVLPGGFEIAARKTYGHISDGMICSVRELGVGDDHSGILVLPADAGLTPGQDARPAVGLDDVVVELNVTPDRGYCLSARGVARELSGSLGVPFRDPGLPGAGAGSTAVTGSAYPITVADPVGCDRFAAQVVRGIDPGATTPAWMVRRLAVAGIRSISLAVDITNYVMLDLGQPMHAFDLGSLRGPLLVRRAVTGEQLVTLDGVTRRLDPEDMVICDIGLTAEVGAADGLPISLAAVMGGQTSEVEPTTVDLLLEAAHWDPLMVARTSRRHKLTSEASRRYERGVDRELCRVALARSVELLVRHGGGAADPAVTDLDVPPPVTTVRLAVDLPSRLSGVRYPPERVVELLTAIGGQVVPVSEDQFGVTPLEVTQLEVAQLEVTPPSWRPDLIDPADLVEEVVRLDGYDQIPSVLPVLAAGRGLTGSQRLLRSVGRTLAEAGYTEVLSYPFLDENVFDALGLAVDDPRRSVIRLVNPLSDREPAMRTSLLPPLLNALRRNAGRGQRDVALYEIGSVFHPSVAANPVPPLPVTSRPSDAALEAADEHVPVQPWHVAAVLAGEFTPTGWWGPGRPADWADAVQAARLVAAIARIELTVRAAEHPPWHPGRCAELLVDGVVVGSAGELDPTVCTTLELPRRTCAMELNLDALPVPGRAVTPAISTFPPVLIDVALVVDAATPAAQVEQALVDGAGELLESVRLFDVYTGAQLGGGRRSLAYKLVFRASDRTLTSEDAVSARDRAVATAAERLGASLRS